VQIAIVTCRGDVAHFWALLSCVVMVEQRAPVLRSIPISAVVLVGSVFYRRLALLNSAALAALLLLVAIRST
jgi:hypothetical protein